MMYEASRDACCEHSIYLWHDTIGVRNILEKGGYEGIGCFHYL